MSTTRAEPAEGHDVTWPIDLVPLAVLVLDRDLRALTVNRAWEQMAERSAHDSRGTLWWNSIDPRDRAALEDALACSAPTEELAIEHRVVARSGTHWTRWWWQQRGEQLWVCVADVDDERARARELLRRATHDALTGLANRTEFMHLLERALDRAGTGSSLAVVYVDLDDFKAVNDSHGHRTGDEVLVAAADAIVAAVRPFDIAARLGGDEFAVLCPGLAGDVDAHDLAERVRVAVAASGRTTGIPVTATVGVATTSSAEDSPDGLVARADQAMYQGKATRRERDRGPAPDPAPWVTVGAEEVRDGAQLCAVLVPLLFRIGLSLHVAADGADGPTATRLLDAVGELDEVITSLRRAALAHLLREAGNISAVTVLSELEGAIGRAEDALRGEWVESWAAPAGVAQDPADLVHAVQLLRSARRALDPAAIG